MTFPNKPLLCVMTALCLIGCPDDDTPKQDNEQTSTSTGDDTTGDDGATPDDTDGGGATTTGDDGASSTTVGDDTTSGATTAGDTTDGGTTGGETTDGGTSGGETTDGGTTADPTLCDALSGVVGITSAVELFVGDVLKDDRVNGYFLNSTVSGEKLKLCLVQQLATLAECTQDDGAPYTYPGITGDEITDPVTGCRDMTTAHAGLGISKQDFDDLLEIAGTSFKAAGLDDATLALVGAAMTGFAGEIVEDPSSDGTIYQRLGRKPTIMTVINAGAGSLLSDVELIGFFAKADAQRLATCLISQVCAATGGPCKFGLESVLGDKPCLTDMAALHAGMTNGTDGPGISRADFDALVGHFATALLNALTAAGVENPAENPDFLALAGALNAMCADIVAQPAECEDGAADASGGE